MVMGLVPHAGSQHSKRIHNFVAWGSAPIMLIIEACLVRRFGASVGVVIITAIILQTVALGVFLLHKPARNWITLIGQAVFFAGFTVSLFAIQLVV